MSTQFPLVRKITIKVFDGTKKIFEQKYTHHPIIFGRSPKATISIDKDFLSRSHAVFTEENGRIYLIDLESSNGVRVNGKRISKIEVVDGLEFNVGTLKFLISLEKPAEKTIVTGPSQKTPTLEETQATAMALKSPEQTTTEKISKSEKLRLQDLAAKSKKPVFPFVAPMKSEMKSEKKAPVTPKVAHQKTVRGGLVPVDFDRAFLNVHPSAAKTKETRIQGIVTWHGSFLEVKEFRNSDVVTIGPRGEARLNVPTIREPLPIAKIGSDNFRCYIPSQFPFSLNFADHRESLKELIDSQKAQRSEVGYKIEVPKNSVAQIDLGSGMQVFFRYIPESKPLPDSSGFEPEENFGKALTISGIFHSIVALLLMLNAPDYSDAPRIKNVPPRLAKILMEKPKPKPTPPPPPKPEKKQEVVKKPEKRIQKVVKVEPKVFKVPKEIVKKNKFPMEVKNPVVKAPPPVKVEALGALASLNPVNNNAKPNVLTNININKNAGGLNNNVNTGGIVTALKATGGKLAAGGMAGNVKTKGKGFGSGTEYGVQGLKGNAGARAVAGAVVGPVKLAKSTKVEGLTRAQILAALQKYLGEIQSCYERSLLSNANLAGKINYEWDISAAGRVTSVRIKANNVSNGDNLADCVKGIIQGIPFPTATNGQTTTPNITFPFGRL